MVTLGAIFVVLLSLPTLFVADRFVLWLLSVAIVSGVLGVFGLAVIAYGPKNLFMRFPIHPYAVALYSCMALLFAAGLLLGLIGRYVIRKCRG